MRKKTLGVVMSEWFDASSNRYLMIRWAIRGEYMPRASYDYYHKHNLENPDWQNGPHGGNKEYLWYDDKDYFKVVQ
jgi:hypothetical protein